MSAPGPSGIRIAIACGGTGGHLFPGLAVAEELKRRGCAVTLLVSPKEVDQESVKGASGVEVVTLPGAGLQRGSRLAFVRGFIEAYRASTRLFCEQAPDAALGMGGFTSAPPLLAARKRGAPTFLHESNTIPGRANRWLSWVVDGAFVGFPEAARRLHTRAVTVTGTPVRPEFGRREAVASRTEAGLDPARPVVLVQGGSQGASGLNDLVIRLLPIAAKAMPAVQWFHLAGPRDAERVREAYAALKLKAVVHGFFERMELALAAATAAVSRAGASSLAELAAARVPAVLVPYPAATANHQLHNAQAYVESGAARLMEERGATAEGLAGAVRELVENEAVRGQMRQALAGWDRPKAAEEICAGILGRVGEAEGRRTRAEDGKKSEIRNPKSEPNGNSQASNIKVQGQVREDPDAGAGFEHRGIAA